MRSRIMAVVVGVSLACGALAACGQDDRETRPAGSAPTGEALAPGTTPGLASHASAAPSTPADLPPSVAQSAAAAPHRAPVGPGGNKPTPRAAHGVACTAGQLTARVIHQPGGGAKQSALLTLTNGGTGPCRLGGWADVTLIGAGGRAVDVPTDEVEKPAAPVAIVLAAGRSAFAGLTWMPCTRADCRAGTSLTVTPPDSTTAARTILIGFRAPIAMRSLRVGALQPTTDRVTGW